MLSKKVEALLLKNHDIMNKVINFIVDNWLINSLLELLLIILIKIII